MYGKKISRQWNKMNVNGIVIAVSEKLRFEETEGFLVTLYNPSIDIHFSILIFGNAINWWKAVNVTHCYKFTNLKVGVLEACSGLQQILLKTTALSNFLEIKCTKITEFELSSVLKQSISVPGLNVALNMESACVSKLVSYQGCVTEISKSDLGLYELDNKILLYTTYNVSSITSNTIKKDSEVFVSNAHLIRNKKNIILICCGLSSVKLIGQCELKEEEKEDAILSESNFCLKYALSVYDLLWFDRVSMRLKEKFSSLVQNEDIFLQRKTDFFVNILEFFLSFKNEFPLQGKYSLVDEYFSNPHKCFAFAENKLPIEIDIPYISDSLDEVITSISWISVSKKWKFAISNQENRILIGILYLSTNGNFYIIDSSFRLPVVLTEECSDCSHGQNIMNQFTSADVAFLVALLEYDIIFENILDKNGSSRFLQYVRTSSCCFITLAPFQKIKQSNSASLFLYMNEKCVNQECLSTDQEEETMEIFEPDLINYTCQFQRFLILSKMWCIQDERPTYFTIQALYLPEKLLKNANLSLKNDSVLEDSFNYYDTADDMEFAALINQLNYLCLDDKPRLCNINFKSFEYCNFMSSGHIYGIGLESTDFKINKVNHVINNDSNKEMLFLTATPDMKILHDSNCSGTHNLEHYGLSTFCSVKDILLKRDVQKNCIVTGVLMDKFYEESKMAQQRKSQSESADCCSLCLLLKSNDSQDTIRVYIPNFQKNVFGLLPGSLLELYGFFLNCSQKGNLYLKASSIFGIEVKYHRQTDNIKPRPSLNNTLQSAKKLPGKRYIKATYFHAPFRQLCFVVKIISATVFWTCKKCIKTFKESCFCGGHREIKIKVSAIIDNGNDQLIAYCSGQAARKLLALEEMEWNCFVSDTEHHRQSLRFSDTMHPEDIRYLPVLNQAFFHYCASPFTCRQMYLEYVNLPDIDLMSTDMHSVWCTDVTEIVTKDVMLEFYVRLKQANTTMT